MDEFLLEQQYKHEEWIMSLFDENIIDEDTIYYGDCGTNILDEQIAPGFEDEDEDEDEDEYEMFSDDGGYKVDPIEEAAWQESLELEAMQTHHALHDYGSDD